MGSVHASPCFGIAAGQPEPTTTELLHPAAAASAAATVITAVIQARLMAGSLSKPGAGALARGIERIARRTAAPAAAVGADWPSYRGQAPAAGSGSGGGSSAGRCTST
jgi:hypothetical protein